MVALPQVTLLPGSLYSDARDRNLAFQLSLDNAQLTCQFTSAANLTSCPQCPAPGDPSKPTCSMLPGQMGKGGYYGRSTTHHPQKEEQGVGFGLTLLRFVVPSQGTFWAIISVALP